MKKQLIFVLLTLVLASLACNLTNVASGTEEPGGLDLPLATEEPKAKVIFEDDFSSESSGWYVGDDLDGSAIYKDGRYEIGVKPTESGYWSSPDLPDQTNVTIEVTAISTSETIDNDFGIICRALDGDNQYLLLISADGYATIGKLSGGEFINLGSDQWITSSAINQGRGATNNLRADCVDDTFALYVNGTEVLTARDSEFSSGIVGLTVGSYTEPNAAVEFDDFKVTENNTPVDVKAPIITDSGDDFGGALFSDDFSDPNSGWDSYRSDEGDIISDYEDGAYRLFVNKESWLTWGNPYQYFDGDVIIEVDAVKIGGSDNNDFGVICRYVDENNFYLLKLSNDGYSQIAKYSNGEYVGLSSEQMEQVSGINAGSDLNRIRAECVGSELYLYVNDNLVASASDSELTAGDVGLYAGTFDEPGTDILFDNFFVTAP